MKGRASYICYLSHYQTLRKTPQLLTLINQTPMVTFPGKISQNNRKIEKEREKRREKKKRERLVVMVGEELRCNVQILEVFVCLAHFGQFFGGPRMSKLTYLSSDLISPVQHLLCNISYALFAQCMRHLRSPGRLLSFLHRFFCIPRLGDGFYKD